MARVSPTTTASPSSDVAPLSVEVVAEEPQVQLGSARLHQGTVCGELDLQPVEIGGSSGRPRRGAPSGSLWELGGVRGQTANH
jgi:hypothetical protein